jgi:hypothetical protein
MTRDISIVQGLRQSGDARVSFGFSADVGGQVVTGPQKAAQRFILLFMTEVGSVFGQPTFGTEFMSALHTGQIRTDVDVELYFMSAAADVLAFYRGLPEGSVPDDELITAINLTEFALSPGYLLLRVALTTAAGTSREVLLPVTDMVGV